MSPIEKEVCRSNLVMDSEVDDMAKTEASMSIQLPQNIS